MSEVAGWDKGQLYHRQLDILPPKEMEQLRITVIGAGAIGSFTVLNLAKMGVEDIEVYDDDTVEIHNVPNQWYRLSDIGKPKVEALADIVYDFSGVRIKPHNVKYIDQNVRDRIVISGVDSMTARKAIWAKIKYKMIKTYIEGRMGAEVGMVFTVNPGSVEEVKKYEKDWLYDSKDAVQAKCTAKSTMYCASGLSSMIAAKVASLVTKSKTTDIVVDFRNLMVTKPV